MDIDRVKHSFGVALKMREIGKSMNLEEEHINDLFILGLNHDIGYQFNNDGSKHNKVGGEILKKNNYKYWREVYYHGELTADYNSLYLDILNLADMQVDKYGNDVGFDNRLLDIKSRYGENSIIYKKCYSLVKYLKSVYNKKN